MPNNQKSAVFPGSFDPFTNGHIDIVERSLEIFETVHVAVLENFSKNALFSPEERVALIEKIFKKQKQKVIVETFSGLLVDYVKKVKSRVIIRGLRAISDFDYEAQMALMNRQLDHRVETLFMMTREENSYISSTLVKQVAPYGGDVSMLVHPIIAKALQAKYSKKK